MGIDDITTQEWDSLRQPSMQERFDKNQATVKQIEGESNIREQCLERFSKALNFSVEKDIANFIPDKASEQQVAGRHYKKFKIQPAEFCHVNNIPYLEASAIKYLCRWRDKNGFEDLQKAKHFIDLLMEYENAS